MEKTVYSEITLDDFKKLQLSGQPNQVIILKFGAEWCKPCKLIKDYCYKNFSELPEHVICIDLDIDETIEIYGSFKSKKMINGVPTLLAFFGNERRDFWYVPDCSVSGTDENELNIFFKKIKNFALR